MAEIQNLAEPNTPADIAIGKKRRSRIQSANTTNATLVHAGKCKIVGIVVGNSDDTDPAFLKLFDKATAPTAGTTVPNAVYYIPPLNSIVVPIEVPYALGIGYSITGAAADSDTTAVAANQVTGEIIYSYGR